MSRDANRGPSKYTRQRCTMLVAALVLGGCAADDAGVQSSSSALVPGVGSTCVDNVYVGSPVNSPVCPTPSGGWTVTTLPGRTIDQLPVCRYHTTAAPPISTVGLPVDYSPGSSVILPMDWLDRDCAVVVPLADDPVDTVFDDYNDGYHTQMARPEVLPFVQEEDGTRFPSAVRVAVIDSSDDSEPGEIEPTLGPSPHGRQVSLAICESTCPLGRDHDKSACIPEFATYNALDVESAVGGGHVGLLSTLAKRIGDAVKDWQRLGRSRPPLVINLAVGWHPDHHMLGNYETVVPSRIRHSGAHAVYAAIQKATCAGALVVAAAGNQVSGLSEDYGALYPAAWADHRAYCGRAGPRNLPLLHAASGVDPLDEDLESTRAGSRTELVAPAFMIALDNEQANPLTRPGHLPIQSGSSFAAAGVSAAATVVWGYHPDWTATEVMDYLYRSSVPLGRTAELCLGNCEQSARISICKAVLKDLEDRCKDASCGDMPRCSTPSAGRGAFVTPASIPSASATLTPAWSEMETDCGGPAWSTSDDAPEDEVCPNQHFYSPTEIPQIVHPQPPPDGCAFCFVLWDQLQSQIYIGIRSDWNPSTPLSNPVLRVGNKYYAVNNPQQSPWLTPGSTQMVQLPNMALPSKATLMFTIPNGFSTVVIEEPIPVYH